MLTETMREHNEAINKGMSIMREIIGEELTENVIQTLVANGIVLSSIVQFDRLVGIEYRLRKGIEALQQEIDS